MKILLIEDSQEKRDVVIGFLEKHIFIRNLSVDVAAFMSEASALVLSIQYDLIITDLMLPFIDGGKAIDAGLEITKLITKSQLNSKSYIIALSQYSEIVNDQKEAFENAGVILLHYASEDGNWRDGLLSYIRRISCDGNLDFVIICALPEERNAFTQSSATIKAREVSHGLDLEYLNIGNSNGACVLLPSMGLVSASIVTSRILEKFNPKIVAMSGICGGFVSNSEMGQLLIANPCWEYQTGKWVKDGFQMEPYQVELDENIRLILTTLSQEDAILDELEPRHGSTRPSKTSQPKIAPFASGSAVISNKENLDSVMEQHRKVAGLDMELYGVYKAVKLSNTTNVIFFWCENCC
jgi:adenosylhomocysteine nucleosidase